MRILVVNAGSSSLKLSVVAGGHAGATETIPVSGEGFAPEAVGRFVGRAGSIDAVGHRIVHGGRQFTRAALIDQTVRSAIGDLTDLAPLHQPKSLAALDAVTSHLPTVPAVACFDTAFHATIPPAASTYAIPAEWRDRWPLRRFGFHGLSHAYASHRAAELVGRPVDAVRLVSCHLGAGASVAAIRNGVSVDTTMGFTPLEGLVMATRSGSVDPGLILWLEEHAGLTPGEVAEALERRSGLLGLAGSGDMRAVLDAEAGGDPAARLAVGVYLHRLRAAIAAMAAALDGLDVLVFTGGVGERSTPIRARAVAGLGFLGVAIDGSANADVPEDSVVSPAGAAVTTVVVAAREDLQIAREVEALLGG